MHFKIESAKLDYLAPVDIKKIDIGGGMIHGAAEDFRVDSSLKIVLAHTSSELNDVQKEIGSQAAFGTVDVLIPSFQDYDLRSAFSYLQEDFNGVPAAQFRMILNNETVVLNPGTIVIHEGEVNEYVYLILSGYVEMIHAARGINRQLVAGTMLGEIAALRKRASRHTYRTTSYVKALKISAELYRDFIRLNNLYSQIERLHEAWSFLTESWLFGDGIPYTKLNVLVQALESKTHPEGHVLDISDGKQVLMVRSGSVERFVGGFQTDTLLPGDVFGEESLIGGSLQRTKYKVSSQHAEIYAFQSDQLEHIPICRWKLRELSMRRLWAAQTTLTGQ